MSSDLLKVIESLKEPEILVVGDAILDRYVSGRVERLSPLGRHAIQALPGVPGRDLHIDESSIEELPQGARHRRRADVPAPSEERRHEVVATDMLEHLPLGGGQPGRARQRLATILEDLDETLERFDRALDPLVPRRR